MFIILFINSGLILLIINIDYEFKYD